MVARRSPGPVLVLVLGVVPIGCSGGTDDLPRVPVGGTVTMDGQPLLAGVIQFYPKEAHAGAAGANGEIKDGKFEIPRDAGPVAGTYRVSISHAELMDVVAKGRRQPSVPSRSKRLGPERIPSRYNSSSTLEVEVKPGGSPDLEFKLESK